MTHSQIREKFLKFFESKEHKIVPSSSLLPSDPSVLFTTAGMQQFKPYLTGKADPVKDFGSKRVFSIQKCFRTTDIDDVGDISHGTFFEMTGNFSFGDYFKKEAIEMSFEFLTSFEWLGLDPKRIYTTAFKGDDEVPRDDDAIKFWQEQFKKVGIEAKIGEKIFLYGREKNWWEAGPGPAGPDAEMFYDLGTPHKPEFGKDCHPNCDCGRFVEIGNDVFVQYNKTKDGKYEPLEMKSVDNGRGFERLVMVAQGKTSIYQTDLFQSIIDLLPPDMDMRIKRIIADHSRAVAFLLADGVRPSNKDQGYVLRRLMRRIIVHEYMAHSGSFSIKDVISFIVELYWGTYPELKNKDVITEFEKENEKFQKTLLNGLRELKKTPVIDAAAAFKLYESFGLPYEIIKELGGEKAGNLKREDFEEEFRKHQEKSRAGAEKKFGGHGLILDTGELKAGNEEELKKATRLHTATHLLHASLRKILGSEVHQAGSDITAERLRFDFTFSRKMTPEEIKQVEDMVNEAVRKDHKVTKEEMTYEDAIKSGALAFFKLKYPPKVNVYSVGDPSTGSGQVSSKELCGGPHVSHTAEIGKFKITKEEAVSAGVRRIRATVD